MNDTKVRLTVGTIVRSTRMHGVFGTVIDVRDNPWRHGRDRGEVEYNVAVKTERGSWSSWIDENWIEVATFDEIHAHFDKLLREQLDEIRTLKVALNSKRRPVKYREDKHEGLSDAYRHADGSITYIVYDNDDPDRVNPRNDDGCVATLIQVHDRYADMDSDDADLREAYERWSWPGHPDHKGQMRRYLAMFRPDILHFDEWSTGSSGGWGYVTREAWERWMGEDYDGPVTPEMAFEQEVDVYRQWANGEIYGGIHERKGKPSNDCWGFLGYEDRKQIAMTFTDSPIVDTLY